MHLRQGNPTDTEETSDMAPNDKPAIITVAVPLPANDGSANRYSIALREAEAIATQAGGIPHSRRVHFSHTTLEHEDDDDLARITARPELQPADTSWLVLTAEVHA